MTAPDQFEWSNYRLAAAQRGPFPPEIIEHYNELLVETDHFFAIPDIGSFVPGYLLIVPKENLSSMGAIAIEQREEFRWLVDKTSQLIMQKYDCNTLQFEHGMCGCAGLDHAHYHIVPVSKTVTDIDIADAIDKTLMERHIGITSVIFGKEKTVLTHPEDIAQILEWADRDGKTLEVTGTQVTLDSLQNESGKTGYLDLAHENIIGGNKYVYFKGLSPASSFFTIRDLHNQFGRQVAFYAEKNHNGALQAMETSAAKVGSTAWNWREYKSKRNMLATMYDLAPGLAELQIQGGMYGFKASVLPHGRFMQKHQKSDNAFQGHSYE